MPKTITGIVSSAAPDKTIIVKVERRITHPLYRKQYRQTAKFMAHDEKNEAKVGDKVEISEHRPLSARKRFILTRIIEKPKLREEELAAIRNETPVSEKEDKK